MKVSETTCTTNSRGSKVALRFWFSKRIVLIRAIYSSTVATPLMLISVSLLVSSKSYSILLGRDSLILIKSPNMGLVSFTFNPSKIPDSESVIVTSSSAIATPSLPNKYTCLNEPPIEPELLFGSSSTFGTNNRANK